MGKKSSGILILFTLLFAACQAPINLSPNFGPSAQDRAVSTYSALQAKANNLYVSVVEGTNKLVANAAAADADQAFTLVSNSDGTVSFQARNNGLYVTVDSTQANALVAKSDAIGTAEKFKAVGQSGGGVAYQASANGQYVCADLNQSAGLFANRASPSTWETFALGTVTMGDTTAGGDVTIKAGANGQFVTAATATAALVANAAAAGDPQTFTQYTNADGSLSFKSKTTGLFVSVDASTSQLVAKAGSIGQTEKFRSAAVSGGVALLALSNNFYVCADLNVSATLVANRGAASGWETFTIAPVGGNGFVNPPFKDFGANTLVFDPGMAASDIQSKVDSIYSQMETAQFGTQRYALLFKPGSYSTQAKVGFYTSIAGLGQNPDDTKLNNIVVDSYWEPNHNATTNFWRSAENLNLSYARWAVSQAAPMRRVHVTTQLDIFPSAIHSDGSAGYSSGGYIADTKVDGQIVSGSQQQFYTRDSIIGGWSNSLWNMVFSGVIGAPAQSFPSPANTTLDSTPVVREKPYLYWTGSAYAVWVPSLKTASRGTTWASGPTPGDSLPISQFYIAFPGVSADTLNQALAAGYGLIFTPGNYHVSSTINITQPNTVVMGLGYATIIPDNGVVPMSVADVDGVKICSLQINAGATSSPVLLQVGPSSGGANHAANPTTLQDLFFSIGGAAAGKAATTLVVNSSDVIMDHVWAWRADHGVDANSYGWNVNTADYGVVVNGANVSAYGLFVEHYQKFNVLWNGNGGKTIFFQNELAYDAPVDWGHDGIAGYAAYKVADSVSSHEAWGLGSYCYFNVNPSLAVAHGFEAPNNAAVKFHGLSTVSLTAGTITNVINNVGTATTLDVVPHTVTTYPAAKSAKRGMAYDLSTAADFASVSGGLSWWYNWGVGSNGPATAPATYGMSYYPMSWNGNNLASGGAVDTYLAAHPECKYLLVMNEPNLADQANLTIAQVVALWPSVEAMAAKYGVKIVGPALNYGTVNTADNPADPIVWLDGFFAQYQAKYGKAPQVDAIAFHWYDYGLAGGGTGYLDDPAKLPKYGKKIWVTEFANWHQQADGAQIDTVAKQKAQMAAWVSFMETHDIVERYAWFSGRVTGNPCFINLFQNDVLAANQGDGVLSELGQYYVNLPVGQ